MNWRNNLQKRWGQPIKFGFQCNALSQDIFRVTKEKISPQTLRRVCGFIQSKSNMSEYTRIVLEKYIASKNHSASDKLNPVEIEFIIPFVQDFFQIPLSSFEDFNYQNACAKIAQRLFEKPALMEALGPFLAKSPIAQIYFFERLPFLDGLAQTYSDLLSIYAQEKTDAASQFFAQALKCYGKKLSNQKYNSLDWKSLILDERKTKKWHPFLRARLMVLKIWEAIEKQDESEIKQLIQNSIEEQQLIFNTSKSKGYFPYYEWIMAEGLHIAERYEDSQYYAQLYLQLKKTSSPFPIEPGYHEAMRVIQYRNAQLLGDEKLFVRLGKEIEIKEVIFLGQRYFRIIFNLAQLKTPYLHTKRKKQIQQQLEDDIAVTGYKYFRKFLAEI